AFVRELAHSADRRPQTAVVADAERNTGFAAGGERGARVGERKREGLFAEYVLPRRRRGFDLAAMLRVRRRQHNSVDLRVGENIFVGLAERKPGLVGEFLSKSRLQGDGAGKADKLALI